MTGMFIVAGFFLSGLIGAVCYRNVGVRAEWAIACLICFAGAIWDSASNETPAVSQSKPKPSPLHRNADALARLIDAHERRLEAEKDIGDAKHRLVGLEVGRGLGVLDGDR